LTRTCKAATAGAVLIAVLASGLLTKAIANSTETQAQARLALSLAPKSGRIGSGQIEKVDVTLHFQDVKVPAGFPLLRLPLVSSNVDSAATTLQHLSARDSRGALHLTARDESPSPNENAGDSSSGGRSRDWFADRVPHGTITVQYSVPAAATLPPRGPAPPFSFTNDSGGVSAAGHVFILLPPQNLKYRVTIAWDLSSARKGSRAISSLGEGRVESPEPMTGEQVRMGFFMAGQIHSWPTRLPKKGFFAAWQGSPAFDTAALASWTGELYRNYSHFFGQTTPPPYGVFLRYNPINAGGGVGLYHSFVITYGQRQGGNVAELKNTLAHEMFHTFQPFIAQPVGLASSWFGEGLAMFYEGRLPLRFGLILPTDYLHIINFSAGRYYTSIMARVPNSEIAERFWADTRIRTLPYDRGLFYFSVVDDQVRKASSGKQSLDDLMFGMLKLERAGKSTSDSDWETALSRNLGAAAVSEFRAFLDGKLQVPPSDAFGPCFQQTSRPLRRYEVGFDPAVLAEPKRLVRGLVLGSAAATAGLRNGDEIVKPVPQDNIQGDQAQILMLTIRRDGKVSPISYLPRGETVEAYQWERVNGVPDSACPL
jgi:hypothetical protein